MEKTFQRLLDFKTSTTTHLIVASYEFPLNNDNWMKNTFTYFERINSRFEKQKNILEASRIKNLTMSSAATHAQAGLHQVEFKVVVRKIFQHKDELTVVLIENTRNFLKLLECKISILSLAFSTHLNQVVIDFH